MESYWVWFGLMALALIGEVVSGTFYLLMVALGFAVGGVAAWLGFDLGWQIAACAVAVPLATWVLRRLGVLKKRAAVPPASNADLNIDIGQQVKVETWDADRVTQVWYRGAHWRAELAPGAEPKAGIHVITALHGSSLVLTPV